ncbi:MAG: glycosyltransferase family 4 protein [Duncaniella sp.]|nr:glycosyltransferase family 4 protein [Duncaniella sp.]HBI57878.1 glycosyltransferase WbuB [Porphyromonadaceae bacterium]
MDRRILIIVENLPVPFDTRVWQEASTLAANGYTVSVICPKGKGYNDDYECIDGVHIYRHDLPTEGNGAIGYAREYFSALWNEYRLARKIYKKHGFHVIHGCNPPDDIYMVARMFRGKGVDYVFDHHDICPELYEAKFGKKSGLFYKSQLWLERNTYRHCTFAFVTNESYRRIAIERGGMSPDKVHVLRSGPRLERLVIRPPKPEIKRGRRFMIGYLGVIGQQEGIQYMLQAAKHIRDNMGRDDIFWGIVGGGPHLDELRRLCTSMGLDDIVEFTGRVDDNKMLDYLNTADICVNSDEYNEMNDKSTMNKVLEYMALGKPIVQFDLTEGRYSAQGASLYARPNDSVDMAEKIVSLLDDPARRAEMSRIGRDRIVNELSWDHTSRALLDSYDKYFTDRGL